ncbi:hypothetical protein IAT38_001965 [Cryptococcus sp. DSM 104549]
MFLATAATTALLAGVVLQAEAAVYPRFESWSGDGFFKGFRFPTETYDNTTNGDVFWATPHNTSLLYTTDAKTVILKVDNTSIVPYNEKRYAPKLFSKTAYDVGTVWVMDAVHMPYGCSVWPAIWTQGPNWPDGGEIDISEGINLQSTNMIALHTANGSTCTVSNTTSSMTGDITQANCDNQASENSGCTVMDRSTESYGAGFAAAGGGVYVTEWALEAIRVWFLPRASVPEGLKVDADSIDTSTLGVPVVEYPASTCDIENLFGPQIFTLDITLCGDFAGIPSLLEQTCGVLRPEQTCYTTFVINDAAATYANAYYEINYINVYSTSGGSSSSSASGSETASSTAAGEVTRSASATPGQTSVLTLGGGSATTTITAGPHGWQTSPVGVLEGGGRRRAGSWAGLIWATVGVVVVAVGAN